MNRNEYSAGTVKLSFWFSEFKRVIHLLSAGKTLIEIKAMILEENLFAAPTQARSLQIFNAVSGRVKTLDPSFYTLFENSDIATQKVIALIAILNVDTLFFDFVYEVYREKLIIGSDVISDPDIRIFFKDKQVQSEKVAQWQDYTLHRLGACYKTMLMEAGVIEEGVGERKIVKPILDRRLENLLMDQGMELFINALTGVR